MKSKGFTLIELLGVIVVLALLALIIVPSVTKSIQNGQKEADENTKNSIILSARNEEYDKLRGFDLGTDDYLTKPFSPKELIARIKAILKRTGKMTPNSYEYKGLKIDYPGHSVYIDGKEIKLTLKEYELLCYFVLNENIALSREQLLNKIWGYDFYGDDRTIDTHVKMLRNNLGPYRNIIQTVRGVGYKFVVENEK